MYVEDKYAIYHYVVLTLSREFYRFFRDSIPNSNYRYNHQLICYINLDLLESKQTILQMMYSGNILDKQLAFEILKTNGCITECNQSK